MAIVTGKKGFTLVEVILVILILATIAAIVLPRITYNIQEAQGDACEANIARINAMAEFANAAHGLAYFNNAATLATFLANPIYFPEPVPANCPRGIAYAVNPAADGRVLDHGH